MTEDKDVTRRTLITGSEGFVGSGLEIDGDVMRVDLKTGQDVLDPATGEAIREFNPHVVYHLAAHHYIPWCEAHPTETQETNAVGTSLVLQACGPALITFVLASSAAVYGFKTEPIKEMDPLAGIGVYAASKQDAEQELRAYALKHLNVRCVAARLFNVVGRGDTWPHVLPVIAENMHERLRLGNVWPLRDYVHVDDVREALRFLARNAPWGFTPWNVGTGEGTSVTMLVRMVSQRAGVEIVTQQNEDRMRSSDGHLVANINKTARLGWTAERSLVRAIDDVLEVSPVP